MELAYDLLTPFVDGAAVGLVASAKLLIGLLILVFALTYLPGNRERRR